jgi:hypothetical protein
MRRFQQGARNENSDEPSYTLYTVPAKRLLELPGAEVSSRLRFLLRHDDELTALAATAGESAPGGRHIIQPVALDLDPQFASGSIGGEALVAGHTRFGRHQEVGIADDADVLVSEGRRDNTRGRAAGIADLHDTAAATGCVNRVGDNRTPNRVEHDVIAIWRGLAESLRQRIQVVECHGGVGPAVERDMAPVLAEKRIRAPSCCPSV